MLWIMSGTFKYPCIFFKHWCKLFFTIKALAEETEIRMVVAGIVIVAHPLHGTTVVEVVTVTTTDVRHHLITQGEVVTHGPDQDLIRAHHVSTDESKFSMLSLLN